MNVKSNGLVLIRIACVAGTLAGTAKALDGPKTDKTPDQHFETLLEEAMKSPEKADWKALRDAFSKTTRYHPYSVDVTDQLNKIAEAIRRGETKETEAALIKLIERERFMRLDALAMLMMLYDKTGQTEKAEKYSKLVRCILNVLDYSKAGSSFDNPIQVLFIDEEYVVTANMQVKVKAQSLIVKNGHRFDVLEIASDGDQPTKSVYFDIDLMSNAKSLLSK
jgi:hypothetical protein